MTQYHGKLSTACSQNNSNDAGDVFSEIDIMKDQFILRTSKTAQVSPNLNFDIPFI